MVKNILLLLALTFAQSFVACAQNMPAVRTGVDVLEAQDFAPLKNKRVGLITNATGVNSQLISTIDLIHEAPGVELAALYGPEHGVRGDYSAGDKVEGYVDEKTGVQVFSLYGSTRKPTPDMLEGIDILVYDIQDIGVRSYTYISTMGLAMEAAAEQDIPFMVLDRPNPLGGIRIEGNSAEENFISFVSAFPIPYIYGLTPGELARMINQEQWLEGGVSVDLEVIEMSGWNRTMSFEDTGLPWVPTSPHIPRSDSPYHYVTTGVMGELGVFSEGVGYTLPFELMGAEWINETEMAKRLNDLDLPGLSFRPTVFKPYYGRDQGKTLHGVQVHITDPAKAELLKVQFWFMQVHKEMYPDRAIFENSQGRWDMFDKVNGSDSIRTLFTERYRVSDIKAFLDKDIRSFKTQSSKYHLYDK